MREGILASSSRPNFESPTHTLRKRYLQGVNGLIKDIFEDVSFQFQIESRFVKFC